MPDMTPDEMTDKEQTELDELIGDAFIGLWMRDSEGDFVSVVDSKNVLKDSLKTALLDWRDKAVREAVYGFHEYIMGKDIIQDETDDAFNYGRLHHAIDDYIKALTQPEREKK